jgi:hypothetical protein
MSLFKSEILNYYNLIQYKNDFLLLHCSKNSLVYAPFDAEIKKTDDGCILHNREFDLYISHIDYTYKDNKVKAGEIIGKPIMGKISNSMIAYIGIKICKDNEMQEPTQYLKRIDKTLEHNVAKEDEVETTKPQTVRRKSNRKRK